MCGIAGIISSNPSDISITRLKRMTDALIHRGPDGEGQWISKTSQAGLGSRRLAIIDLSDAAAQPLHYEDRYTIVFNGEIYNYKELREFLINKQYRFHSQSDTEVIVAAYDHFGEDCILHFDGMFAFAIWDEKERTLFAARDRFGEKPFYYTVEKGQFVFASEMKGLWAAGIAKKPNQQLLFNYLTIGYVDNPSLPGETFYEKIFKLPAAHILKCHIKEHNEINIGIERYWDIDPELITKNISEEEAKEKFYSFLLDSVTKRYRSDVKAGTSLSGGLDSSSIVALSNKVNHISNSHKCFTSVFPGYKKDEAVHAGQVAEKFKLQQYTVSPGVTELSNRLDELFYYQEEPFISSSSFAQFKVYELAIKNQTKVLLDGQGADETLGGYHKYYKWYWQELYRKRKLYSSKELEYAEKLGVKEKFGWKNQVAALFPAFATIFLERQYLFNALKHEDLSEDFVKYQSKEAYYTTPELFSLNGALYFNICIHGLEELLRYADRNSMAHGCEVRLPFLQHELVEFLFSLPSHYKIRKGWTKWLLRTTMESELPENIIWRKDKIGFEPPQKVWMEDRQLQVRIRDAKEKLVREKILKPAVMEKDNRSHDAYAADNYEWRYLTAAMLF